MSAGLCARNPFDGAESVLLRVLCPQIISPRSSKSGSPRSIASSSSVSHTLLLYVLFLVALPSEHLPSEYLLDAKESVECIGEVADQKHGTSLLTGEGLISFVVLILYLKCIKRHA
jgi:hypothetical protein